MSSGSGTDAKFIGDGLRILDTQAFLSTTVAPYNSNCTAFNVKLFGQILDKMVVGLPIDRCGGQANLYQSRYQADNSVLRGIRLDAAMQSQFISIPTKMISICWLRVFQQPARCR